MFKWLTVSFKECVKPSICKVTQSVISVENVPTTVCQLLVWAGFLQELFIKNTKTAHIIFKKKTCFLVCSYNKNQRLYLLICFQQYATLHKSFISAKLFYMFRVISPPIIRSTHNCIYSFWYLSNSYCYLPLSRQVAVTV